MWFDASVGANPGTATKQQYTYGGICRGAGHHRRASTHQQQLYLLLLIELNSLFTSTNQSQTE